MGRHDDDLLLIKLAAVKVAPAVHSRVVGAFVFLHVIHVAVSYTHLTLPTKA